MIYSHVHMYVCTCPSQSPPRLQNSTYYGLRRQRSCTVKNNYVVNLSSKRLPRSTINLLSKGLGYAPTPEAPDMSNLREDLNSFVRRLRIAHFFRNDSRPPTAKHPFKPKSTWIPPRASNSKLEEYITAITEDCPQVRSLKSNLSEKEHLALQRVSRDKSLIIKKADKGSCIVVQDRTTYSSEGKTHLADTSTYKPLPADPTACITNKIKQLVDSMHDSGYIDKYTHAFLCPPEKVRTQRMYFLKKLHKTPHGIRPIVSGCSGPTERVSAFLDHIIKPLVPTTPSYIKDSSHIIALLECTNVPQDALLVTIDVSSLYTNIPQDEGTEACLEAIEMAEASHIPQSILLELFNIVLKCNVFSFDNSMYQQIQGTAMGTKMAPSYANLFMDRFERAFLAQEPILPLVWKRYIDDILCIWTGTRSQLDSFLDRLNKAHHSIKFTWSISDTQIQFLDLNIHKGQRFTQTNLLDLKTYFKPHSNISISPPPTPGVSTRDW